MEKAITGVITLILEQHFAPLARLKILISEILSFNSKDLPNMLPVLDVTFQPGKYF